MPYINVTLTTSPDAARSRQIAETISALTAEHLRKDPSVTAVAITSVDAQHWFAGGRSLAEQGLATYWLDIKVVDGTNTKAELAAYLAAVHAAMGRLIGPVHEESYILVHEVPASAYGFGGKTQEYRYIAAKLAAA